MTMALVSSSTVGAGGAANISFTSIPQTGTDLLIVFSPRNSSGSQGSLITINGSSANFSVKRLYGYDPSSFGVSTDSLSTGYLGDMPGSDTTANTFGSFQIYIPNYAATGIKAYCVESVGENAGNSGKFIITGKWNTSAAITSLTLAGDTNNLAQYSTASLYTITKGSGGATVS